MNYIITNDPLAFLEYDSMRCMKVSNKKSKLYIIKKKCPQYMCDKESKLQVVKNTSTEKIIYQVSNEL